MTHPARAPLEAAVHSYRHDRDPAHLAVLNKAGLDGIARALEIEATALPGIHLDDATARINQWLHSAPRRDAGADRAGHWDGFGLGGQDPTG